VYEGPEFMIEVHLGQILSSFYITLMFSAGMPLLYFVFFFEILIKYWVDKIWFLRLNRTPPRYGKELTDSARSYLFYGVLLHLGIGFMMFSHPDLFADNERPFEVAPPLAPSILTSFFTTSERFQSGHAILYFAVGGFILVISIVIGLISVLNPEFAAFLDESMGIALTCMCCVKAAKSQEEGFSDNIYLDI